MNGEDNFPISDKHGENEGETRDGQNDPNESHQPHFEKQSLYRDTAIA